MKLITLNTWGGRINQPLLKFIKDNDNVDIFCFQEMHNDASDDTVDSLEEDRYLFSHIQDLLPSFTGHFSPQVPGTGHATFVKNELGASQVESYPILAEEEILGSMPDPFPRILQVIHLKDKNLSIYNFHGVPKADKKDTIVRDLQTKRVLEIINKDQNPKIIVGDFNLNPDTRAIAAFESILTNQIKNSGYTTTRSKYYEKIKDFPFADYIFTSPEIQVSEFKVLNDEVSDHLPLSLTFEIGA